MDRPCSSEIAIFKKKLWLDYCKRVDEAFSSIKGSLMPIVFLTVEPRHKCQLLPW